ncbi:unnamed protein product [Symbiodinium sp. CCMP2592]|nr:unnamed protein product [Symbiodinium sp. CCMP2592]
MSNWAFLLQTTEDENREERHIAKQLAEASLQRAKNKGVLLDALVNKDLVSKAETSEAPEPVNLLTTQDIENHLSSLDLGHSARAPSEATTIPGELPDEPLHDVPERIDHPRRISSKRERPVHCRKPFFHHFFAKTNINPDEEKIISELRSSNLNGLLHQLATALLDFAQDVVTEELELIARHAVKNDGGGHVADSVEFGKQPWFVSVKQDLASGNATSSDESSCAEETHGVFVTADMFRTFLEEERHRPLVADLPKHIIDLRHLILQIGRHVYETYGIGIVIDQCVEEVCEYTLLYYLSEDWSGFHSSRHEI